LLAGLGSGAAVWILWGALGLVFQKIAPGRIYLTDITVLLAGTALWVAVVKWVLVKSGSALPRVAMQRLGLE